MSLRKALVFWGALSIGTSQAAEVTTRIHAVERGEQWVQVLSTVDGRVYEVPSAEGRLIGELEEAAASRTPVRLELDPAEERVVGLSRLSSRQAGLYRDELQDDEEDQEKLLFPLPVDFQPSIYDTEAEVRRLFRSMTTRTRGRSQCYQRANYWARHLWRDFGTRSMKVFMFHTAAYRSMPPAPGQPRHRWWFHVAPMVYQRMPSGEIEERVLDRGWPRTILGPQDMHSWSNVFIDTRKPCHVIDSYQAVLDDQAEWRRDSQRVRREAPHREHCLLRIVPMYYYQPLDVEALDIRDVRRSAWTPFSMRHDQCAVSFCW